MTNTLNFRLRKSLLLFLKIIVLDIESYTIFFLIYLLISGCPRSLLLCADFF